VKSVKSVVLDLECAVSSPDEIAFKTFVDETAAWVESSDPWAQMATLSGPRHGRQIRCRRRDRLDSRLLVVGDDRNRHTRFLRLGGGLLQDLNLAIDAQNLRHLRFEIGIATPARRAEAQSAVQAAALSASEGRALARAASARPCPAPWCSVKVCEPSLEIMVHVNSDLLT
jgi:hypothetical protein